jgi:hypothetical protein
LAAVEAHKHKAPRKLAVRVVVLITVAVMLLEQLYKVSLVVLAAALMVVVVAVVLVQLVATNQAATAVLAVRAYRQASQVQVFNALAAAVAVRNLAQAVRQQAAAVQVQV